MSSNDSEDSKDSDENVAQEPEESSTTTDAAAEKEALRKVDWHVLPIIFLLYLVSFLDRFV